MWNSVATFRPVNCNIWINEKNELYRLSNWICQCIFLDIFHLSSIFYKYYLWLKCAPSILVCCFIRLCIRKMHSLVEKKHAQHFIELNSDFDQNWRNQIIKSDTFFLYFSSSPVIYLISSMSWAHSSFILSIALRFHHFCATINLKSPNSSLFYPSIFTHHSLSLSDGVLLQ